MERRALVVACAFLAFVFGPGCENGSKKPPPRIARREPPPRSQWRPQLPPQWARRAPGPRPGFDAAWLPQGGKISSRWTTIVIHHSATDKGGAQAFDKFHRGRGWDELGYHFVIGNGSDTPDGFVEVGPRWHKQKHGAHCKTPDNYYNDHGIGICLVGDFTARSPSPRQLASLERLVRFLAQQSRIPASRVTTHRDVTHKTACPGARFSVASLQRALYRPATASSMP